MALARRTPRLGLVLGSGSARGWAHIGVLQVLQEEGVRPDVVCGASIGALVGAAYAAGELERFADWVQSLGMREVFGFMDFRLSGGMLKGERLIDFWRSHFADFNIEDSPMRFGAVATDLHSGAEVWLREGSIADAVRASIALPGLFTPVQRSDGRLLVDGGIVNPVPTSLARAMGADIVIAVDLNADILHRHMQPLAVMAPAPEAEAQATQPEPGPAEPEVPVPAEMAPPHWRERLRAWLPAWHASGAPARAKPPSVLDVVMTSVSIMQMRITRSRMAGDPPEVVIAPSLAHLGLLDFHRAAEAIEEGRRAAHAGLPQLRRFMQ
ncbi:patatin-like phospholipase family protein [Comamonas flocculans]|uniref:Patatin n=1 Tax=Comamonas flocculans TaxID=2597701 RepID=A0A5B8S0I0_9BURK|nr:patatin-like phospholipase family protein [Comamonas flocculans]QEA14155.1 patatin [Comamonas flocculans]